MKGNLDVSILVDEFDIGVKTPNTASDAASDSFEGNIVFASDFLLLSSKVLEDYLDHRDNGDEE